MNAPAKSQPVSLTAGRNLQLVIGVCNFKSHDVICNWAGLWVLGFQLPITNHKLQIFLRVLRVSAVKTTPLPPTPRTAAPGSQSAPRPGLPPTPAHDRRGWPLRSQYPPDRNAAASPPAPAPR